MADQARYAQMYDEHAPPRPGIEEAIMGVLGKTDEAMKPHVLIQRMIQQGFQETGVRESLWALLDRGYIHLAWDYTLEAHPERISPAPVDLL